MAGEPEQMKVMRRLTASGVSRHASEMAGVYHFLASRASTPLTGSLLGADDGISAGLSNDVLGSLTREAAE